LLKTFDQSEEKKPYSTKLLVLFAVDLELLSYNLEMTLALMWTATGYDLMFISMI